MEPVTTSALVSFKFYFSSINSDVAEKFNLYKTNLNSTLVQLIGNPVRSNKTQILYLNSTLVQLIGKDDQPVVAETFRFKFYFSSINRVSGC